MKYHPHGSVLFITFSVEEGLLLLSNPLCKTIVKSCLASAQQKHPVTICHFLVQATHIHLVIVVENPDDVPGFVRYFKTESAHMLNRVLGRKKRTIWCEGYDSPVVLTPIRAAIAISYLYANPAKDNLVDSIEDFPGLSSWRMQKKGKTLRNWRVIRRNTFRPLARPSHSPRGYESEAKRIMSEGSKTALFQVTPNAWMESFGIKNSEEQGRINSRIRDRIAVIEKRSSEKRIKEQRPCIGKDRLINQRIDIHYLPRRGGKRMWCLSESRLVRISFIQFMKELFTKARSISKEWVLGDYSKLYPPGLYPPSLPKRAEPVFCW